MSHQLWLEFLLATDVHLDALHCLSDFYFSLSFFSVNKFYVYYEGFQLFVDVIFVFLNLLRVFFLMDVFFWWILTFCNTFVERVFFTFISRTIRFAIFWYFFCYIFVTREFLYNYFLINNNSPQLHIFLL